ncbi:UPF0057 membrane protein At4g30650 [Spinacia oleracea]|uniref:UPF0057 membrane protein At4g30650 n=1 Tax=Spinacia oleracea TaxID=3562 RepID=A0A9R0K6P6_SPIOL|nr:UPF0057 membrane protein At4g30650-like [Spinacia oleracea]
MAEANRCHIAFEILLAILLPPLGVCLRTGCCTCEFLICVVLTLLGYIPGIIYAIYVIAFRSSPSVGAEDHYRALPQ